MPASLAPLYSAHLEPVAFDHYNCRPFLRVPLLESQRHGCRTVCHGFGHCRNALRELLLIVDCGVLVCGVGSRSVLT
jgi:hypothetical protein